MAQTLTIVDPAGLGHTKPTLAGTNMHGTGGFPSIELKGLGRNS